MIGKLTGLVEDCAEDSLILNVGGVGYHIYVAMGTLAQAMPGSKASYFVETCVKEDSISLYGFNSALEKQLFIMLRKVQGVGPKIALALIDLSATTIINAVLSADAKTLQSVSGVGAKVASRIVSELKDKISKQRLDLSVTTIDSSHTPVEEDLVKALKGLQFQSKEIDKALAHIQGLGEQAPSSLEDKIREALQYLSK